MKSFRNLPASLTALGHNKGPNVNSYLCSLVANFSHKNKDHTTHRHATYVDVQTSDVVIAFPSMESDRLIK